MTLRSIIAACAFALASTSSFAATILVYGDSLASGYGLTQEQGWVSLLEKRLHAEKINYKVANASISGETTIGGVNRIEAALKAHRPAIVILELGANDGLRGGNLDAMRANLEKMVDTSRKAGARVLLIGMRIPPNYGTSYTEKFHRTFGEIAKSRKLPLVPFLFEGFAEKRESFQADGIHPGPEAQLTMLDTVWKQLQPMLKKPGDRQIGKS